MLLLSTVTNLVHCIPTLPTSSYYGNDVFLYLFRGKRYNYTVMDKANGNDQFRSELGKALNVVTATLGDKSFEAIRQEYKGVERQFLSLCDDSDLQLYIKQNVSERILGDAFIKNCAIDDLERFYKITADLGFSCDDMRISSTITYCQRLVHNNRNTEAKKLLEDLLNHVNEVEEANPGTFIGETFVALQSLLSGCD